MRKDISVFYFAQGESEARAKTKARFDEVLKRYTDAPAEKRKSKKKSTQPEESIAVRRTMLKEKKL